MASILNPQSRDIKHGGTLSNYCQVIILSMKSLARFKDESKSLVYKIFKNEIGFHRLFHGIFKVMFSFLSGVIHRKSADFRRSMYGVGAYHATWYSGGIDHPRYLHIYFKHRLILVPHLRHIPSHWLLPKWNIAEIMLYGEQRINCFSTVYMSTKPWSFYILHIDGWEQYCCKCL